MDWKKAKSYFKVPGVAGVVLYPVPKLSRQFLNWRKRGGKFPPVAVVGFVQYVVDHITMAEYDPAILRRSLWSVGWVETPIGMFKQEWLPVVFFKPEINSKTEEWRVLVNPHFRGNFQAALEVVREEKGAVVVTKLGLLETLQSHRSGLIQESLYLYAVPPDVKLIG